MALNTDCHWLTESNWIGSRTNGKGNAVTKNNAASTYMELGVFMVGQFSVLFKLAIQLLREQKFDWKMSYVHFCCGLL